MARYTIDFQTDQAYGQVSWVEDVYQAVGPDPIEVTEVDRFEGAPQRDEVTVSYRAQSSSPFLVVITRDSWSESDGRETRQTVLIPRHASAGERDDWQLSRVGAGAYLLCVGAAD